MDLEIMSLYVKTIPTRKNLLKIQYRTQQRLTGCRVLVPIHIPAALVKPSPNSALSANGRDGSKSENAASIFPCGRPLKSSFERRFEHRFVFAQGLMIS